MRCDSSAATMMSGKPSPLTSAIAASSAAEASTPSASVILVQLSGSFEPKAILTWPIAGGVSPGVVESYVESDSWTETISSIPSRSRSAISSPSLPLKGTPDDARSSMMCSFQLMNDPSAAWARVGVSPTVICEYDVVV